MPRVAATTTKEFHFATAGRAGFGRTERVELDTADHDLMGRVVCAFELPALVPNRVFRAPDRLRVFVAASRQVGPSASGPWYAVRWPTESLFSELDAVHATRFGVTADDDGAHRGTFGANQAGHTVSSGFDAAALPVGNWVVDAVTPT